MNSGVDPLDQIDHIHVRLCEAGLLLLAGLGAEKAFPESASGLEALVQRIAEGRPGKSNDFAIQTPNDEFPLHTDKNITLISPGPDGCLRLSRERRAVILRADGRLDEFVTTNAQASELESMQFVEANSDIPEADVRFRVENLIGIRSAASQASDGPLVSFVALYRTGVVVYYLVPRPPDKEVAGAHSGHEPLMEAIELPLVLSDNLGTRYEEVDLSVFDLSSKLLRASRSFVPSAPESAKTLSVEFDSRRIAIQMDPR